MSQSDAARRRSEKAAIENEVRRAVVAAGDEYLEALDLAEDKKDALRDILLWGRDQGMSDNRLSQMLTEAIPPGTIRLGRPVPRALMGVRRLTRRAGPH